ncbi:MAG: glycoside hydrolase family 127 protein [Clostridia bacterium]|nr:glycoside hydrolase family 127 protein [Clostridia bacterium]
MDFMKNKNVSITGGYWKNKEEINRKITMEAVWNRFYETGRIKAFTFDYKEEGKFTVHHFWDSDVAKWMEAASYFIGKGYDEFTERMEYLIVNNQMEDGYFNSFFQYPGKIGGRFSDRNMHELYCAGHLMEAACAYYEATGKDRFLRAMERYAELIEKVFIKEESAAFATPGHEEIELALVKMYKTTGKEKYLDMARFFIDKRGGSKKDYGDRWGIVGVGLYSQSHMPVREQETAEGHAVRATYLYSAMADVAKTDVDEALGTVCEKLFSDIVNKKMYITGAIGSSHLGEAFTVAYDLPNERAYAETCASIGLVFFANRMTALKNDASYADVAELALYNGMMAGLGTKGDDFFYTNPLEICLMHHGKDVSVKQNEWLPITQRKKIFDCSCCPPNLNRVLASIGGMIYGYEGDTLYVNQFAESKGEENGLWVKQKTGYPNDGHIILESNARKLCIRIPSRCNSFTANVPYTEENGYAVIDGGYAEINLGMKPMLVEADPRVYDDYGKAALIFGPLVYCIEGVDNKEIFALSIQSDTSFETEFDEGFGLYRIKAKGIRKNGDGKLYSPLKGEKEDDTLEFIPYSCFANRGESDMKVWIELA